MQHSQRLSTSAHENANIRRVRDLYNGLQLEMSSSRQQHFLALVQAWLSRYSTNACLPLAATNSEIDTDTLLDDATLAFLFIFGPRLWPSPRTRWPRAHLQDRAFLCYDPDIALEPEIFGASNLFAGRFRCQPLRQAVREYLFQVSLMEYDGRVSGSEWDGIDELFARVIDDRNGEAVLVALEEEDE